MTTRTLRSRLAAVGLAAVAGVVALAGAVVAPAEAADSSTITGTTGSLTIHALDTNVSTADYANGLENPVFTDDYVAANAAAIPGMKYLVYRITDDTAAKTPLNLTEEAAWSKLAEYSTIADKTTIPHADDVTPGTGAATGTNGAVKYANLPIGAYLVLEDPSSDAFDDTGRQKRDPFVVTVPTTNPTDRESWVYDVHVYPKSPVFSVTKAGTDTAFKNLGAGEPFTWTITAAMPGNSTVKDGALTEGQNLTKYTVTDAFNGQLVFPADFPTDTDGVVTVYAGSTATTALPAANYTVTSDKTTHVTVDFGPAITAKNADFLTADVIRVEITAAIAPDAAQAGVVDSIADEATVDAVLLDRTGDANKTELKESAEFETKYRQLKIQKVDQDNKGVNGAQFAVFTSEAAAKALDLTEAVSVGGENVFTTETIADVAGMIELTGLRYSTVPNTASAEQKYYVREVKAPAGYELSPLIKELVVDENTSETLTFVDVVTRGGFMLPLAGGAGLAGLSAIGLLILGASAYAYRRTTRQGDQP